MFTRFMKWFYGIHLVWQLVLGLLAVQAALLAVAYAVERGIYGIGTIINWRRARHAAGHRQTRRSPAHPAAHRAAASWASPMTAS